MDPYMQDSQNIYLTGELRAVYSEDVETIDRAIKRQCTVACHIVKKIGRITLTLSSLLFSSTCN